MSKQAEIGIFPAGVVDFARIAEESPDGLFIFDRDYRYVYVNAAAERMLGRARHEVIGRIIWDEYPDAMRTPVYEQYRRAMRERVPVRFEMLSQVRPGAWVEAQITPYADGALLVRARDITERKRAEKMLRLREARYRTLIEATAQIVWTADAEGRIDTLPAAWLAFTGQMPDARQSERWQEAIHPEDRERCARAWREAVAAQGLYEAEYRLRRYDGVWRTVLSRAVPVVDTDDNATVREWVGTITDITDRKRAEAKRAADVSKQARIAETLQRSLLLTPPSDAFPGLTVEALYEAAWDEAKIGGDFADIFAVDETQVALVVGDVTGKGLAAASYTAEVKFALRAFLREYSGAAVSMQRLNRFLYDAHSLDHLSAGVFVALSLVVIDTRTGEFTCATGGMEPPLIVRSESGAVQELSDSGGPVLGAMPNGEFETVRDTLNAGDILAMTTDGITEARRVGDPSGNLEEDFFGNGGLGQAVCDVRALPSLSALAQVVALRAREFAGGRMRDDVCLLLARREPDR